MVVRRSNHSAIDLIPTKKESCRTIVAGSWYTCVWFGLECERQSTKITVLFVIYFMVTTNNLFTIGDGDWEGALKSSKSTNLRYCASHFKLHVYHKV
jgi:hypothetical protein